MDNLWFFDPQNFNPGLKVTGCRFEMISRSYAEGVDFEDLGKTGNPATPELE